MRNWVEWHQEYDRPESSLSRRSGVVRSRLKEALGSVSTGSVVLSLCAGDGRDVITVLRDHPDAAGRAVLVELDPGLAAAAMQTAKSARITAVEVRCQDAGAVDSFIDVLPVDVLMLCGIFGNIAHSRVRTIVELVPRLLKDGGHVIWTRGGSVPDRRPEIRRWFTEAGLEEIAFDGAPERYGVGLNRMARRPRPTQTLPARLFTFA